MSPKMFMEYMRTFDSNIQKVSVLWTIIYWGKILTLQPMVRNQLRAHQKANTKATEFLFHR